MTHELKYALGEALWHISDGVRWIASRTWDASDAINELGHRLFTSAADDDR